MLCSFFLLLIHLPSLQFAFSNVVRRLLATTHLGSLYTLPQGAQTTRSACRRWPVCPRSLQPLSFDVSIRRGPLYPWKEWLAFLSKAARPRNFSSSTAAV